jgi:hypothetical protein
MSDELSKRDIRALAESNVGLLPEVKEAIELLAALGPVLDRAQKACKSGSNTNAAKSASDENDAVADATAGEMVDAAAKFRVISCVIDDLNRYL